MESRSNQTVPRFLFLVAMILLMVFVCAACIRVDISDDDDDDSGKSDNDDDDDSSDEVDEIRKQTSEWFMRPNKNEGEDLPAQPTLPFERIQEAFCGQEESDQGKSQNLDAFEALDDTTADMIDELIAP